LAEAAEVVLMMVVVVAEEQLMVEEPEVPLGQQERLELQILEVVEVAVATTLLGMVEQVVQE
jgi:hypothetical protein